MFYKFKKWIKEITGIAELERNVFELEWSNRRLKDFVSERMAELKKFSRVDADVGVRGSSTIILTGVYRNRGYVAFYDMPDKEFGHFVEEMKLRSKSHLIRNIDAPMDFHAAFDLKTF